MKARADPGRIIHNCAVDAGWTLDAHGGVLLVAGDLVRIVGFKYASLDVLIVTGNFPVRRVVELIATLAARRIGVADFSEVALLALRAVIAVVCAAKCYARDALAEAVTLFTGLCRR